MKKFVVLILTILTVLSMMLRQPYPVVAQEQHGPRHSKGLDIFFYETPDLAYGALKACAVDFIQWSLTQEQKLDACEDPNLQLASYLENGIWEFDINNNFTIPDNRLTRNPCNELSFRQAIAHAVDKDWIIDSCVLGEGKRIDQPIAALQTAWCNETVIGPNYPYPFNMTKAAELLDENGFDDYDGDNIRNYPLDWPGVEGVIGVRDEPNLDPLKACIRNDDPIRLCAGNYLADQLATLKIPVNPIRAPSDVLHPMVMGDMNYHVYTGGWGLGRFPTYTFFLFHSRYCYPYGFNYVTGFNSSGQSNYPDVDEALEGLYYAKTVGAAVNACKRFCGLHAQYCINIPLWSTMSYMAYSKYLVGVVNMDGYGIVNDYTFLNAYKVDDPSTPQDESQEPIRIGTVNQPKALNILYSAWYSVWYYDYTVLDRIYTNLLSIQPYNLAVDQPWVAQDWEESTWIDPQDGQNKTKVMYWLRKDVRWKAPETCEFVKNFTAHDVEFTTWYIYAFDYCWHWPSVMDVHHTKIIDDYTIEVYFQCESIWDEYRIGFQMPLLGPKETLLPLLCEEKCVTVTLDRNYTACEKFMITDDQIVQVINCTKDETIPLEECVDFQIVTNYSTYEHNLYHTKIPIEPCQNITLCYWTPDIDPRGLYLAHLDWTETMYSIGPYCPTEIVPGVGGWAKLKCNDCFFLETPPLGEIDWRWYWQGTAKPRSGFYRVSILDVVRATAAYCSRGDTCPPSPNWFPGADLERYDPCHIGIYDIVTIISKYGKRFGKPP